MLVLEPNVVVQENRWIKSTERAKRLLIPPVYSFRGIRAYDELQIAVTEVGQVKQTVTGVGGRRANIGGDLMFIGTCIIVTVEE